MTISCNAQIHVIVCIYMPNLLTLTLYVFAVLMLMYTLGFTYFNDIEGQLAVPDITQRVEQPSMSTDSERKELMAMQGIFSQTGQILGFGLNVNNGSLLCPSNNCEFRIDNGMLKHDFEGYSLEGKLNVTETGNNNSTWYEIEANLKEPWDKQSVQQTDRRFLTGFLFTSSLSGDLSPHYYIYNGTLITSSDNSTLILQGRDY